MFERSELLLLFVVLTIFFSIIIFIAPVNVFASQSNLDLSSAQTSVGKRFAKVFCDAKNEGLDSEFASEYALNNTYLKFVAFPDDDKYLDDLWQFTSKNISDNCGDNLDLNDIKELEIFFKEEGIIASNRDFYLPKFENN
tara:strand:+ start:644 stop:1063 length:420 start_codon:yes stop_codon:yes gene_type:complete